MGLDMYLSTEKYVGRWEHDPSTHKQFDTIAKASGMSDYWTEDSPHLTVSMTVGYWRKANQIHSWFVQEVQGGVDECQRAYVGREKLQELRTACLRVISSTQLVAGVIRNGQVATADGWEDILQEGKKLDDPAVAEEHLPTAEGFFFGSTDYDEWYFEDLKHTVKVIDKCLAMPPEFDFYYQSSW